MTSYIPVATGQCGNQLCYELLNQAFMLGQQTSGHVSSKNSSTKSLTTNKKGVERRIEAQELLEDGQFRLTESLFHSSSSQSALLARAVCLDTEPKVIEDCINLSRRNKYSWRYDVKSIAYRHGGAGNNWALGYTMAHGDFLDLSINCIRRQIEQVDSQPYLLFINSLAGGTGSGLGTHMVECCREEFGHCGIANVVIAPYHFGEIVVQYYNALLCLSKIERVTDGLVILENEMAQVLSRTMYGLEKPSLGDLNNILAAHIVPPLLPKINYSDSHATHYHSLSDDISYICAHPFYRFFSVKITPQTSKKSIDFTFDSWTTLLRTIQRMQMSGSPSERTIPNWIKSLGRSPSGGGGEISSSSAYSGKDSGLVKSVASVISIHGEGADAASQQLQNELLLGSNPSADTASIYDINRSISSSLSTKTPSKALNRVHHEPLVFDDFLQNHADLVKTPVRCNHSGFLLNNYQRSSHIISNDQSVLPLVQRTLGKSEKMFRMGAYLHQYTTYGVNADDFVESFQSLGSVVQSYSSL